MPKPVDPLTKRLLDTEGKVEPSRRGSGSSTTSADSGRSTASSSSGYSILSFLCAPAPLNIHQLCIEGRLEALKLAFEKRSESACKTLATQLNTAGFSPLHYVVAFAKANPEGEGIAIEMAKLLVRHGGGESLKFTSPRGEVELPAYALELGCEKLAEHFSSKLSYSPAANNYLAAPAIRCRA